MIDWLGEHDEIDESSLFQELMTGWIASSMVNDLGCDQSSCGSSYHYHCTRTNMEAEDVLFKGKSSCKRHPFPLSKL